MTDKKLTLYAWENNAAAVVWAVQGENKSRTLELTIIETRGGEGSQWGAEVIDKPLDLTGMSAPRLYVSKPDNTSVFVDGVIVDAKKGIVSFALTAQQLAVPGTASCQIVLTKPSGEVLKVIGMQLDIQRSGLDDALESDDDFKSVVVVLDKANAAADKANAAADKAESVANEIDEAYKEGRLTGPQGAPGSVGLGNCNIAVDSNRLMSSAAYIMGTFDTPRLIAGAVYTIVACFDAPPGQSLLVAASNGSTMANLSTPTTGNIYVTRGARAPSSIAVPELRVYNYPQGASSALTLHWMCVYSGNLSDPPLYWTPAQEDVINANVKASGITISDGKTLEDVLQEGGLLPATNKGTWKPAIILTGDNTAEFQRSSYAVSGSNVMVQTYMRFTHKTEGINSILSITGLPFISTAKIKGEQVQGWLRKTEPRELYPTVNVNSSTLSITATIGAADMPVMAGQLEDGQAWAHISITYPIK